MDITMSPTTARDLNTILWLRARLEEIERMSAGRKREAAADALRADIDANAIPCEAYQALIYDCNYYQSLPWERPCGTGRIQ